MMNQIDEAGILTKDQLTESGFILVTNELSTAVRKARYTSYFVFVLAGIFATAAVTYLLPNLNELAIKQITGNKDSLYVFLYELVRTTAAAAVIGGILWGLFNLAKASLDQATRYEKRLIAAHFLHYTLATYQPEIRSGQIALADVMSFLRAWSENVESAYTRVKFGAKGKDQFAMTFTPAGVSFVNGGDLVPPPPVTAVGHQTNGSGRSKRG